MRSMRFDVLTTVILAMTLASPLQVAAASFNQTAPPPSPSALQDMLDRPGVSDALGPFALADLREAIVALGRGDFAASVSFAERVTRSAPDVGAGWHILGLAHANAGDFEAALTALERASGAFRNNGTPDLVRGDILTLLERPDKAAEAYASAINKDAGLWPALIGLGDLALERGDTQAALTQFRRATAIAPKGTAEPMERVAQTLIRTGDTAAADRFLADTATETDDPAVWRRAARLRLVTGDIEGAEDALAKARDIAPTDRDVLADSADVARSMGRPEDAAQFLTAALEQAPDDPALASTLALVQIESGNPEDALAILDRWSDASDTAPEAVIAALAVSNAAAGDLDTAERLHAVRTERFPTANSFADRAAFLIAREDFTTAKAVLDSAVTAFPNVPGLRLLQGRLLAAQRDYTAAQAAFGSGLALAPDDRALLRNASAVAQRLGDLDSAQDWAATATRTPGSGAEDQVWLGAIAAENGDRSTAIAAYRAAIDTDSDNIVALNNLAVLLTADAPAEAVGLARRAVDIGGERAALLDTLGWALHHDGNLTEARAALEAALAERPDAAVTQYRLGRTLADLGEADAARAAFARALEIDPAFEDAEDARARLEGQ